MRKSKPDKEKKLVNSTQEVEALKNQLARALADYDNLRKRVEKEKDFLTRLTSFNLLGKLLPLLDMLRKAQEHLEDSGLAIVIAEFEKILNEENILEYKTNKGEKFNETIHEAVDIVTGGNEGSIAESVLSGWKYSDGGILRIEKVKVYK